MTKTETMGDLTDIKKYLSYNPETGIFMWIKQKSRSRAELNVPIINDRGHGYLRIKYNTTTYCTHRLAWWWVHGGYNLSYIYLVSSSIHSYTKDKRMGNG